MGQFAIAVSGNSSILHLTQNYACAADVYALGGEMIALDDEAYEFAVAEYVEETGVPFLSVAFCLASESRGHLQVSIHGR